MERCLQLYAEQIDTAQLQALYVVWALRPFLGLDVARILAQLVGKERERIMLVANLATPQSDMEENLVSTRSKAARRLTRRLTFD
jgi:hypothetical protein